MLANNLNICQGKITRQRKLENRIEEAILDFTIINEKLQPFLSKMTIDEERNFCLSNFAQVKKNGRVVETDHNMMIMDFNISVPKRKRDRVEIFNLKNETCQKLFKEETENNKALLECFEKMA